VREDDLLLLPGERVDENRVPEHDATGRPEPEGVGIRLVGIGLTVSTRNGMCPRPSLPRPRAPLEQRLVFRGVVVKSRYGATNENSAAIRRRPAAPGSHQCSPSFRASPMTMRSAMQIERNSAASTAQSSKSQSR
jgi:hypothetical protein